MNRLLRDGPNAKGVRPALLGGVLALLVLAAWIGEAFACFPEACLTVEKYASTTGLAGPFVRNSITVYDPSVQNLVAYVPEDPTRPNYPAQSVIQNMPTDIYGDQNKVTYLFVIKNCGTLTLKNLRFGDCIDTRSVGDPGFLLGASHDLCVFGPHWVPKDTVIAPILYPGESMTLSSESFPLFDISHIDVCDTFGHDRREGIVRNDVIVQAEAMKDSMEKTCSFEDLNLVKCTDTHPGLALLGDRVWRDYNENGVQDCTDVNGDGIIGNDNDTGAECGAGVPGVTVKLVNCQTQATLRTTVTDQFGFYRFPDLPPGQYCVQFDQSTIPASVCQAPALPQLTTQNVGPNDAIDSDANPVTGLTGDVNLLAGQKDLTVDAGVVCRTCPIAIDKKCQVQTPPSGAFVCSEAKPIDSLTMIWNGDQTIYVKAWKGLPGSTLLATLGPIAKGQTVTVSGMGGSPLDQVWEIFVMQNGSLVKIGQSQFHISCSDVDMNGPEDCGKLEGNAKTTSTTLINNWIFEGMSGNGQTLSCTAPNQTGTDTCSFTGQTASCQTLGAKPKTLVFRYTGSDCSASSNSQAPDKWFCTGTPGSNPTIQIVKDPARITVSPLSGFGVGSLITVSTIGSDMGSEIQLNVGGQSLKIHTSCSQPLAVGDVFGSLELVQFNGQGAGSEVTYSYEVRNNGAFPVDIVSILDNRLGELLSQPASLAAGGVLNLSKSTFVAQSTTNEVVATARLAGSSTVCGSARDQLTVSVTKPTCALNVVFDTLSDDTANFKITNTSSIMATLETFVLNFPASYGAIKEIRLDGSIFKSSATVPVVGSGQTISGTGWTNPDITKRQLNPGETRTLQVIFTKKGLASGWVDIMNLGGVTFREGCEATFPSLPPCKFGRPNALTFQYTGQSCAASNNDQAADKWFCSGDPAGAQPVSIVMTKDASLLAVSLQSDANGNGRIDVGDTFQIRRIDNSDFNTETLFNIVSGSTILQSLKIHTSCSQPLNIGDQFGSVILKGFQP